VTDRPRSVVTEEGRERLYAAKRTGEACAACGRPFDADRAVYHERFMLGPRMLGSGGVLAYASVVRAPVGEECASAELLAETAGIEPERCGGCGRGVYYDSHRRGRQRAFCSSRCRGRANSAKQRAKERG
jgi:hypothetical protein